MSECLVVEYYPVIFGLGLGENGMFCGRTLNSAPDPVASLGRVRVQSRSMQGLVQRCVSATHWMQALTHRSTEFVDRADPPPIIPVIRLYPTFRCYIDDRSVRVPLFERAR